MSLLVVIYYALELLKWTLLARIVISWVAPHSSHPIIVFVRRVTDPILRPLSEMLPSMGGLDLSPLLAFFAIHLFQELIIRMA